MDSLKHALRGLLGAALALLAGPAAAQAPFATDDAGVTPRGYWHFELFGSWSDLQPRDLPATGQATLVGTVAYGLFDRLEIGADAPWIAIEQQGEETIQGLGDLNFSAKFRLREYSGGWLPGAAISAAVETPTGDDDEGLGSGVVDYGLTLIGDWQLSEATALRANAGVLFAGNNLTGAVGLRTDSEILTFGLQLTRTFSPRWDVGLEVGSAEGRSSAPDDQELFSQLGARYLWSEKLALAGGVVRGWRVAPEWLVQVGLIWDP